MALHTRFPLYQTTNNGHNVVGLDDVRPIPVNGGRSTLDIVPNVTRDGDNTAPRGHRDDDGLSPVDDIIDNGQRGARTDTDTSDNPYTNENGSQTNSDSPLNTSDTISDLSSYLNDLGGQISNWKTFYDLMQVIFKQTGANDFVSGDSARLAITEKIADMVYNFTTSLYENAFQSQLWYEQQEYNSPLNQLHRLSEAGLLGMWQQIDTGNASTMAGSSDIASAEGSHAAELMQAEKQRTMEKALQGVGLITQFASLGVDAYKAPTEIGLLKAQSSLAIKQSELIDKLSPEQVRSIILQNALLGKQKEWFDRNNQSNLDLNAANIFATYKGVDFAKEKLSQGWANFHQTYKMFQENQGLQRDLAKMSYDSTIGSASISASATRYAADQNAFSHIASNRFSTLAQFTLDYEEEGYQEVNQFGQTTGRFMSKQELFGLGAVELEGGATMSKGDKRYKRVTRTVKLPASDYIARESDWCNGRTIDNFNNFDAYNHTTNYVRFGKDFSKFIGKMYQQTVQDTIHPFNK